MSTVHIYYFKDNSYPLCPRASVRVYICVVWHNEVGREESDKDKERGLLVGRRRGIKEKNMVKGRVKKAR